MTRCSEGQRIVARYAARLVGVPAAVWPKAERLLANNIDRAIARAEVRGIERGASIGSGGEVIEE